MSKFNIHKVTFEGQDILLSHLFLYIASLETMEEVKNFLQDLLTPTERAMLARRILIAELLNKDITYEEIIEELGVGKDTISRVEKWLNGERNGYRQMIKKIERKAGKK